MKIMLFFARNYSVNKIVSTKETIVEIRTTTEFADGSRRSFLFYQPISRYILVPNSLEQFKTSF